MSNLPPPQPMRPPLSGLAHEIASLDQLRANGAITDEEFASQKARLLAPPVKPPSFWSTSLGTILIVVLTLIGLGIVSWTLSALGG